MGAHLRFRAFNVHIWPAADTDECEPAISEQTNAFTSLHATQEVMTAHGLDYADMAYAEVANGSRGGDFFYEARYVNGQLVYQPGRPEEE